MVGLMRSGVAKTDTPGYDAGCRTNHHTQACLLHYTASASNGARVTFAGATRPQAFARIPDPHRNQGTRYAVAAILSPAVVAVRANHTAVLAIAEWAARQPRHVRRARGFRRTPTPHRPTIP